jgi:pyruvate/oxaloacetate carboxyltransferase
MVDSDERLVTKGLKSQWIAQVKDTAGKMLAATDWMVIRQVERSVAVPAATATYRAAVLTEAARLEAAIAGAADIDAFIAVVQDQRWPEA